MLWVTPFLPNARTRLKTAQCSPSEFWQDLQRPVPFEFGALAVRTPTNHGTGSGLRVFGRKKPHLVDDRRNIVTPLSSRLLSVAHSWLSCSKLMSCIRTVNRSRPGGKGLSKV